MHFLRRFSIAALSAVVLTSASVTAALSAPAPRVRADLALSVSASSSHATTAESPRLTADVVNSGGASADAVVLTYSPPAEVTVTPLDAPCSVTSTVTCDLGTMSAGERRVVTFAVSSRTTHSAVHAFRVATTSRESTTSNNASEVTLSFTAVSADLELTAERAAPHLGAAVYSVTVKNHGPNPAVDTKVTYGAPGPSRSSCVSTNTTCQLGTLAPGEARTIEVAFVYNPVTTDRYAYEWLSFSASATSATPDPNTANNGSGYAWQRLYAGFHGPCIPMGYQHFCPGTPW